MNNFKYLSRFSIVFVAVIFTLSLSFSFFCTARADSGMEEFAQSSMQEKELYEKIYADQTLNINDNEEGLQPDLKTEANDGTVNTLEDLKQLNNSSETFTLNSNIIITQEDYVTGKFSPIENFSGTFKGNSTSNLFTITYNNIVADKQNFGLFNTLNGTVSYIDFEGSISISGNARFVGGVSAHNTGHINNCKSNVSVTICEETNTDVACGLFTGDMSGQSGINNSNLSSCSVTSLDCGFFPENDNVNLHNYKKLGWLCGVDYAQSRGSRVSNIPPNLTSHTGFNGTPWNSFPYIMYALNFKLVGQESGGIKGQTDVIEFDANRDKNKELRCIHGGEGIDESTPYVEDILKVFTDCQDPLWEKKFLLNQIWDKERQHNVRIQFDCKWNDSIGEEEDKDEVLTQCIALARKTGMPMLRCESGGGYKYTMCNGEHRSWNLENKSYSSDEFFEDTVRKAMREGMNVMFNHNNVSRSKLLWEIESNDYVQNLQELFMCEDFIINTNKEDHNLCPAEPSAKSKGKAKDNWIYNQAEWRTSLWTSEEETDMDHYFIDNSHRATNFTTRIAYDVALRYYYQGGGFKDCSVAWYDKNQTEEIEGLFFPKLATGKKLPYWVGTQL